MAWSQFQTLTRPTRVIGFSEHVKNLENFENGRENNFALKCSFGLWVFYKDVWIENIQT